MLGQEQRDCYKLKLAPKLSMLEILRLPSIAFLMTLYFLVYLAFNFFYIAFPIHAVTRLGWSLVETGIFFTAMSLMMVAVQGPLLKWAASKVSDRALVTAGSLLLALAFVFYMSASVTSIYAGTALLALGNGLMWPSLLAIVSKATNTDVQGAVQGFAGSVAAVASIIGLLAGGFMYGVIEARIFAVSAAITGVVFVVALFGGPSVPQPERQV
jgi:MFS family permease